MKLLCIKTDKTTTVYKVEYKKEDIVNFIGFVNSKYKTQNKETIKTTFNDNVPMSFGHLENKAIKINSYKIKNINKPNPVMHNGLFFLDASYGEIDVFYEKRSDLGQILEDTFLSSDDNLLLDMTNLIKYRNKIYGVNNNFKFDRTIDLNKKREEWCPARQTFKSVDSYNEHLSKLAYNLNEPLEFINSKEYKKITSDMKAFLNIMYDFFNIEEVAMYPTGSITSDEYKIMERYALRNADCNYGISGTDFNGYFQDKLFRANVNFDGAQIIDEVKTTIKNNYDLDGYDYNINALKSIKNNQLKKEIK